MKSDTEEEIDEVYETCLLYTSNEKKLTEAKKIALIIEDRVEEMEKTLAFPVSYTHLETSSGGKDRVQECTIPHPGMLSTYRWMRVHCDDTGRNYRRDTERRIFRENDTSDRQ